MFNQIKLKERSKIQKQVATILKCYEVNSICINNPTIYNVTAEDVHLLVTWALLDLPIGDVLPKHPPYIINKSIKFMYPEVHDEINKTIIKLYK